MELGISEINKVCQVIKSQYNLDFSDYAYSSFKRRISRIIELNSLQSIDSLIDRIENKLIDKEDFLSELTVNVTELFRDPSFWKKLNLILEKSDKKKIKIWHAGCSSGEEVFSMIILLNELNKLANAELLATDIDLAVLKKAEKGQLAIKNKDVNFKNFELSLGHANFENYFYEDASGYRLKEALLSKVNFRRTDLVKDTYSENFDIIICRNVMIYFNQKLQDEVLKNFFQSLNHGGLLCIGSKESITSLETLSKLAVVCRDEKIFKKY